MVLRRQGSEIIGFYRFYKQVFKEDALWNHEVRAKIEKVHNMTYKWHKRHVLIGGKEVDVVAVFETLKGKERAFGFELKENDYIDALKQAEERMPQFDYFYIILKAPPWWVQPTFFCELAEKGIGLFCGGIMIVKAKHIPRQTLEESLT